MASSDPASLASAGLKQAQSALYSAVGAVSSDPSWKEEAEQLSKAGTEELEAKQEEARNEAFSDRIVGKAQSAYGAVVGDQETQNAGNLKVEGAEWKQGLADGELPSMSVEKAKGKLESAVGMVTGDAAKQTSGNMRVEKSEWVG